MRDEVLGKADEYAEAVERSAWDGEWYRRAYFDDGSPLGSRTSDECKIDSIAQSWSVISGAAKPERASHRDAVAQQVSRPRGCTDHHAAHAAVRQDDARSRLHPGISARGARERCAVHARCAVGCARDRATRQWESRVRAFSDDQSDHARATVRMASISTRSSRTS